MSTRKKVLYQDSVWSPHSNTFGTILWNNIQQRPTTSWLVFPCIFPIFFGPFFWGPWQQHQASAVRAHLAKMDILTDASNDFLTELVAVMEPCLLLPGQCLVQDPENPKLYFIIEGHLHVMKNGFLVQALSSRSITGILDVYGIDTGDNVQVKTDEICKVGTVSRPAQTLKWVDVEVYEGPMNSWICLEFCLLYRPYVYRLFMVVYWSPTWKYSSVCTLKWCPWIVRGRKALFSLFEKFEAEREKFEQHLHHLLDDQVSDWLVLTCWIKMGIIWHNQSTNEVGMFTSFCT